MKYRYCVDEHFGLGVVQRFSWFFNWIQKVQKSVHQRELDTFRKMKSFYRLDTAENEYSKASYKGFASYNSKAWILFLQFASSPYFDTGWIWRLSSALASAQRYLACIFSQNGLFHPPRKILHCVCSQNRRAHGRKVFKAEKMYRVGAPLKPAVGALAAVRQDCVVMRILPRTAVLDYM